MLSVVIIAWNEEAVLSRCLASIRGLADEVVVVVDESTTDLTAEIAKNSNCKVFFHPHTGIVEPMRNFAISKSTGDWVLVLDADEEVSPGLALEIQKHLQTVNYSYIRIPRKNIIFNKWITSDHWWPDYVYRLFKRGSLTWPTAIHSVPKVTGSGLDIEPVESLALIHHNYQSISQYLTRLDRYTDNQSKSIAIFKWQNLVLKPVSEFLTQFFARKGYNNGLHGFVLSLLQAFSEFIVWLKVWQRQGFTEGVIRLTEVNSLFSKSGRDFTWWHDELKIQQSTSLVKPFKKIIRKLKLS